MMLNVVKQEVRMRLLRNPIGLILYVMLSSPGVGLWGYGWYLGIYNANYWDTTLFFLVVIWFIWFTLRHIKDYFSIVIFSDKGVESSLFGWKWFQSNWSEIRYVGEFIIEDRKGGSMRWMYFSSEPLESLEKIIGMGMQPQSKNVYENAIFTSVSEKSREKLLQFIPIPKDQIEWRGTLTVERKFKL